MKISNANLVERLKLALFEPKARIEIVSLGDLHASKDLKTRALSLAKYLTTKHPNLKIIEVYKTNNLFNLHNLSTLERVFSSIHCYAISIPRNSNLLEIKKDCIPFELDIFGLRVCDIDVYETRYKKISRKDLGYSKDLS